ncbi:hypothetical protein Rs2_38694 [Raphanus sativus]|nr:hypothetical protein Rs2_38694 [Raphanus sativus]
MTRSKEKKLKEGFNLAVQVIMNHLEEPPAIPIAQPTKVEHSNKTSDDLSNAFAQLNITQGKPAYLDETDKDVYFAGTEEEALPDKEEVFTRKEGAFPSEDEDLPS